MFISADSSGLRPNESQMILIDKMRYVPVSHVDSDILRPNTVCPSLSCNSNSQGSHRETDIFQSHSLPV